MAAEVARSVDSKDPGIRINALRSLGTYRDSVLVARVVGRLDDPHPNVRVQAATTIGELGGSAASAALQRAFKGRGGFALQREALLGLARSDSSAFTGTGAGWRTSADWRERATVAEGWAAAGAVGAPWFVSDKDGRVVAAGLQSWLTAVEGPDSAMMDAARRLLPHPDAAVRSVAADALTRGANPGDLGALVTVYGRAARDSFPEAALSALNALVAIAKRDAPARGRVEREFLAAMPRPSNYLVRRWAEDNWPDAAARWGPPHPIATGRTLQDYRDLARQFIVAPDSVARPHVRIETEQRGTLEVELSGLRRRSLWPTFYGWWTVVSSTTTAGIGWCPTSWCRMETLGAMDSAGPGAPSGTRSTACGTISSPWWGWRCRDPTPGPANGSSRWGLSLISTARTPSSDGWSATWRP